MADTMVYENPTVRVKGYRRGGHRVAGYMAHRNPEEQNPMGLSEQFFNGSDITQGVSIVDIGVGAVSVLAQDWITKLTGLRGYANIVASSIVPVVAGAMVGMVHGRYGSVVFLTGEVLAALKLIGMTGKAGLTDAGDTWVLSNLPATDLGARLGLASAGQVEGMREYRALSPSSIGSSPAVVRPSSKYVVV